MTIFEFIRQCGCRCHERADLMKIKLPNGETVSLAPRIEVFVRSTLARGTGRRPRIARLRRRWLRARRRSMRRAGKPPTDDRMTSVYCHGCESRGSTPEALEGAW